MIDLFADTGGVPLAFGQAGFNFEVAVEIDPAHCSIHVCGFSNAAPKCAVVVDSTREDIRERANIRQSRYQRASCWAPTHDQRRLFRIGAGRELPLPKYQNPNDRATVKEAIGDLPTAYGIQKPLMSVALRARPRWSSVAQNPPVANHAST